ncbi:MAG: RNA polymerase-associated protein RapA [Pseudomonadota bacterium]
MSPFVPGQRWLSTAEPELGLGTVLRADPRQVQVLFAATGTMRVYAVASAPLLRAAFRVGDKVNANGARFVVEGVEDRDGVLHYRGGGQRVPEGALDDVQDISKADDRLLGGRVDRPGAFDLRLEALERRAQARRDAGFGALSARIDLVPHQLRVAEIASERRPPRVLLADEVGLGKTIEACTVIARLVASGRAGRVLVLLPEALVYQWFVELRRRFNLDFAIFDEERAEAIEAAGDGRNPFLDEQMVITDLGFLAGRGERAKAALKAGWDLLVVDEAHHLAWSPESASREYQLVDTLARRTPGVLLLTATPEQLGRSGHFARLRLLDPARYHDLEAFQREGAQYLALSRLAARLDAGEGPTNADLAELERLLGPEAAAAAARGDAEARTAALRQLVDRHGTGRVMFRNRRAVVGGFPRRVPRIALLPAATDDTLRERLVEEFLGDIAAPPFAPPLSYLDDPRLAWLVGLLDAHAGEKFLLITRCQPKLHALEEALRLRSGVAVARFHEGLGIVQRDRAAAHFADPGGARLLLCTEIGSEGRNFQFAQHLVLWDFPLDPDLLEQRIGRLDRIGQRGDVNIHACVFESSAQHALLRWLDEGLGALTGSPEDGRELLKRHGERVVACALSLARGDADAVANLDARVAETGAAHADLAAAIAEGRDRLLELTTRLAPGAERLLEALAAADADRGAGDFILRLFEHFGIDIEEQGPQLLLLDPEMLSTEAFPGLDQPRQATFHRPTALAREDVLFLRLDHPMVVGALDLLLGAETGNAAFAVDDSLPPRSALLEAVLVLECIAPPKLGADRFLPPLPLRCVVDTRLADRGEWRPDAGALGRSGERNIDVARYRKHLAALVPPMLGACRRQAEARAAALVESALAAARATLGEEIDRLEALARVNSGVRASEIDAARDELAMLEELLPKASLRLDALRFVASVDFLSLRS